MPILDSIREAESIAEKVKNEAIEEAKALLESTKEKANLEALEMIKDAELKVEKMTQENNDKIHQLQEELQKKSIEENETSRKIAQEQFPTIVDLIVKKVLEA